jgi:hypothetical protein
LFDGVLLIISFASSKGGVGKSTTCAAIGLDMARGVPRVASKPMPVLRAGDAAQSTPRARMKTLNVEVPDYAWIAIKMRAAQEMSSVRHVIMTALKAHGIEIRDADMIEDGRRLRGSDSN